MVRKLHIGIAGIAVAVLGIVGLVTPASAIQDGSTPGTRREEAKARIQGKLDDAKKKVCAARTNAIKRIMQNAGVMGERHLKVFSGIQARVEEFYAKKQLTVANYEALKAVAVANYDIAAETIEAVKGGVTFDCDSDDPVGAADVFKAKVKVMHSALKDYRSAINALLVAVKTAASGTEGSRQ